jgi:chitodextrinase
LSAALLVAAFMLGFAFLALQARAVLRREDPALRAGGSSSAPHLPPRERAQAAAAVVQPAEPAARAAEPAARAMESTPADGTATRSGATTGPPAAPAAASPSATQPSPSKPDSRFAPPAAASALAAAGPARDTAPPSAPSALAVTAPGTGGLVLSWQASQDDQGIAGYELLRADKVVATTAALEHAAAGLASFTEYCHYVRAFDAAGNRSERAGPACARTADTTPPTTPALLALEAAGETVAILRFERSTDDDAVARYDVLHDAAVAAVVSAPPATLTGLAPAREYCLALVAVDRAGNPSPPSERRCVVTPDLTTPTAPAALVAQAAREEVRLTWKPSRDNVRVVGYDVLGGGEVVERVTEPAHTIGALRAAVRYCFAVRARDGAGNLSPATEPACATPPDVTPPSIPGEVVAAPSSAHRVMVGWQPSSDDVGVTGYELVRGDEVVARASGTFATVRGLKPLTEYCYGVRAVDAAGNRSRRSADACARTADPASPPTPLHLEAEALSPSAVGLRWESSGEPDVVYRVYAGSDAVVGVTTSTSFVAAGLPSGAKHCHRVSAVNEVGVESARTLAACARTPAGAADERAAR